MISLLKKIPRTSDHEVRDPMLYHMDPDTLGFLHRRSKGMLVFSAGMALVFVGMLAVFLVGNPTAVTSKASVAGMSGAAVLGLFALAAWGGYRRPAWGRFLCATLSTVFVGHVIWYMTFPAHWNWSLGTGVVLTELVLGWIGMVCFFGTGELFGKTGIAHADLVAVYQQSREEERELARIHAMDWTAEQQNRAA